MAGCIFARSSKSHEEWRVQPNVTIIWALALWRGQQSLYLRFVSQWGIRANLAREENALQRKYLDKSWGSTQPKFGIAECSHTEVLKWPSPGNKCKFLQALSVLGQQSNKVCLLEVLLLHSGAINGYSCSCSWTGHITSSLDVQLYSTEPLRQGQKRPSIKLSLQLHDASSGDIACPWFAFPLWVPVCMIILGGEWAWERK